MELDNKKEKNKQKREIIDFPLLLIVEKLLPSIDFEKLAARFRIHTRVHAFSCEFGLNDCKSI